MPRGGQKSYIQQMHDDNKKKPAGPAKGNINPYQYNAPKTAKKKTTTKKKTA